MAEDPKIRERYHISVESQGFKGTILEEVALNGVYYDKLSSAIHFNRAVICHNYLNEMFLNDEIGEIIAKMWELDKNQPHTWNVDYRKAGFP